MVPSTVPRHDEHPLKSLLAQLPRQVHIYSTLGFEPDLERTRITELPADLIRPAIAQRDRRKHNSRPARPLRDRSRNIPCNTLAPISVREDRKIRPVLLDNSARKDHDGLFFVQSFDLLGVHLDDLPDDFILFSRLGC